MAAAVAWAALVAVGGPIQAAKTQELTASMQPAPRLPVKLFAQLERAKSAEISPDGKHFVSISSRDGRYCLTIHALPPGSGKTILYPPYDPQFEYLWAHWASDSRVLVSEIAALNRGRQGMYDWSAANETRLFSAAADGSAIVNAIRPIKEQKTGSMIGRETANSTAPIQDDVIDWLPKEDGHVLVSIWDRPTHDRGASVRKIDVATGEYSYVKGGVTAGIVEWHTDRAAEVRLGFGYARQGSRVERWLTYKNPATAEWIDIRNSPLTTEKVDFAAFDSDPRYAFVLGPDEANRRALLRWDVAADHATQTVYSDPHSEVERVIFNPDRSRQIIGVVLRDDRAVYLDPVWKRRMAALADALPAMHLYVTSATRDGSQFIVHATSPVEPGVYYLFDSEKHSLTAVEFARNGLEAEQLAPARWIEYAARDGPTIHAVLTVPRGLQARNLPTVLLPHGGPLAHDSLAFDWMAQFLANRGYVVLQPNFRGSTGYGIAFERAGDRQWGRAMQDDLTDGAQWLVQQGIADPKRMAIVGGSYGGYAALMGAVKTPDLFRCAVSLNGVSDLIGLLTSDTGGFKDEAIARLIGDPVADRDMLDAVSPIRQVEKIQVPVLLVHAKDDLRVEFDQSKRMFGALQRAGKAAEFIAIENGEHWLLNEASRAQFLTALEQFLAKNLQPRTP